MSFPFCFASIGGGFSHRYFFCLLFLTYQHSFAPRSLALHVLTNRVELFVHPAATTCGGRVQIRRRRHNVDRADLGPFDRRHRVFAQHLEQDVPDDDGEAGDEHAHKRVLVQLDDDPSAGARDAHQRHDDDRLGPVLDREALLPVEAERRNR